MKASEQFLPVVLLIVSHKCGSNIWLRGLDSLSITIHTASSLICSSSTINYSVRVSKSLTIFITITKMGTWFLLVQEQTKRAWLTWTRISELPMTPASAIR